MPAFRVPVRVPPGVEYPGAAAKVSTHCLPGVPPPQLLLVS
ncbi:hypothetical protein [Nonomuraea rhizosphaerae]|nr:hypothetical protein [Nonomuraea rhizosphaerae]